MTGDRFRIESVKIEGFKGFTSHQELELGSQHLLLLGDNSCGKTSVLEAIRWALIGGVGEETLRNPQHIGDCQVELRLKKGDEFYRIHRRLRLGSGKSDVKVYRPDGSESILEEVFPSLPRLIQLEGMYVILAEQSPSRRRTVADVSDFSGVIYTYLGWDELVGLISKMEELVEEYTKAKDELGKKMDDLKERLRHELDMVTTSLKDFYLISPPWAGMPPTIEDTRGKVLELASTLAQLKGEPQPDQKADPETLLGWAERLVNEYENIAPQRGELEKVDEVITQSRELWRVMKSILTDKQRIRNEIEGCKNELMEVCQGQTIEQLNEEKDRLEGQVKGENLRVDVLEKAKELLGIAEGRCPVCENKCDGLLPSIDARLKEASEDIKNLIKKRDEAGSRYERACELSKKLNGKTEEARQIDDKVRANHTKLCDLLSLQEVTPESVEQRLGELERSYQEIEQRITDVKEWSTNKRAEITRLRRELDYHKLNNRRKELEWWLKQGLEETQTDYNSFGDLLDSVDEIKIKVFKALETEVDRILPPLSEEISQAYQNLTGQRAYDKIKLTREGVEKGLPKITSKVYSSSRPLRSYDPLKILNAQALNALYLAPYFVFSKMKGEVSQLDLLMFDDPAQGYDKKRFSWLLKELKKVATHAQLIIASPDPESFSAFSQYFSKDEYKVLMGKDFDPDRGPVFESTELSSQ